MKTNDINKIALSIVTASLLVLSGCGSSGGSSSDTTTTTPPTEVTQPVDTPVDTPTQEDTPTQDSTDTQTSSTVTTTSGGTATIAKSSSGTAIDGILVDSTVCIDVNKNNACDLPDEPNALTDADGKFAIPETTKTGPLLLVGGTDSGTGLPFAGTLSAPEGSTVVTPLTSAIQSLVKSGESPANAQASIIAALGLPDIDLVNYDPFQEILDSNQSANAQKVLAQQTKLQVMVHTVSVSISEAGSSDLNSTMDDVFDSIAKNFKGARAPVTLDADSVEKATKDVAESVYASDPAARVAAKTVAKEVAQTAVDEADSAEASVKDGSATEAIDNLNASITKANTTTGNSIKTIANDAADNAKALSEDDIKDIEAAQKIAQEKADEVAAAKKAAEDAAAEAEAQKAAAETAIANGDANARELYEKALDAKAQAQNQAALQAAAEEEAAQAAQAEAQAQAKIAAEAAAKAKAEAEAEQARAAAAKAEAEARAAAAEAEAAAAKAAADLAAAQAAAEAAALAAQVDVNKTIVKSITQDIVSLYTQAFNDVNETVNIRDYIEETEDSLTRAVSYTSLANSEVDKAADALLDLVTQRDLAIALADANSTDINTTTTYKTLVVTDKDIVSNALTAVKAIKNELEFKIAEEIAMEAKHDRIVLISEDINDTKNQIEAIRNSVDNNATTVYTEFDEISTIAKEGYDIEDIYNDANTTFTHLETLQNDIQQQTASFGAIDKAIYIAIDENNETRAQDAQDDADTLLVAIQTEEADYMSGVSSIHQLVEAARETKNTADSDTTQRITSLLDELRNSIEPEVDVINANISQIVNDANATLQEIIYLADEHSSKDLDNAKENAQNSFNQIVEIQNSLQVRYTTIFDADIAIEKTLTTLDEAAADDAMTSAKVALEEIRFLSSSLDPLSADITLFKTVAIEISTALDNPLGAPSFALTIGANETLNGYVVATGIGLKYEIISMDLLFDEEKTNVDPTTGAFSISPATTGIGQIVFAITDDYNNTVEAIYDVNSVEVGNQVSKYDISEGMDINISEFDAKSVYPIPADVELHSFFGVEDGKLIEDTIEFSTLEGNRVLLLDSKDLLWHDGNLSQGYIAVSKDGTAFDPENIFKAIKMTTVTDDLSELSNEMNITFPAGSTAYEIAYLDVVNEFDSDFKEVANPYDDSPFSSLEEFFTSGAPMAISQSIQERVLVASPDSNISDGAGNLIEIDITGQIDGSGREPMITNYNAGTWRVIRDTAINDSQSDILVITPNDRDNYDTLAYVLDDYTDDASESVVSGYITEAGQVGVEYLFNDIAADAIIDDYNKNIGSVLVDPYIVGAVLCEDKNLNDACDEDEQISTPTTQRGNFTFYEPLTPGSNIIIVEQGMHEGQEYDLGISAKVDEDGRVEVISPMTSFLADGEITSQDVANLLNSAAQNADLNWTITPQQVESNPIMGGLSIKTVDMLNDDDFVTLQGSLTSYGVLKVMNSIDDKYDLTDEDYEAILVDVVNMTLPAVVGALNKENLNAIKAPLDAFKTYLIDDAGFPQELIEKGLPEPTTDIVIKMGVAAVDRLAYVGVVTDGNQTALDGNYTQIMNNIEGLGEVYYGFVYSQNIDFLIDNSGGNLTLDDMGEGLKTGHDFSGEATGFRFDDENNVTAVGVK